MPNVTISPVCNGQLFDNSGEPLAGGKVFAYVGGSFSTLALTYSDNAGTVPNANPIVLDSSGRMPVEMWLVQGQTYNIALTLADGTTVLQQWANIMGVDGVAGPYYLSQLLDVAVTSPTNGQNLTYNTYAGKWENVTPTLAADADVQITGDFIPTDGQVLTWVAADNMWEPTTVGGGGGGSTPTWVGRLFHTTAPPMDGNLNNNWTMYEDQSSPDVYLSGSTPNKLIISPVSGGGYYRVSFFCIVLASGLGWPTSPGLTASMGLYMPTAQPYFQSSNHVLTNQTVPNGVHQNPNPDGYTAHDQLTFQDEFIIQTNGDLDVTPFVFCAMYAGSGNHFQCQAQVTVQLITP